MAQATCKEIGCEKSAGTRGWCRMHYTRWLRHKDPQYERTIVLVFEA